MNRTSSSCYSILIRSSQFKRSKQVRSLSYHYPSFITYPTTATTIFPVYNESEKCNQHPNEKNQHLRFNKLKTNSIFLHHELLLKSIAKPLLLEKSKYLNRNSLSQYSSNMLERQKIYVQERISFGIDLYKSAQSKTASSTALLKKKFMLKQTTIHKILYIHKRLFSHNYKHYEHPTIYPKLLDLSMRQFSSSSPPSNNKVAQKSSQRNITNIHEAPPTNENFFENTNKANSSEYPSRFEAFATQLRSIPNMITVARIVSTPCLSYLIITNQYDLAIIGCGFAAFSDYLDGYIAKTYNATTVLGTYLDPLADKLIINTLALSLTYQTILPAWTVAIWLGRDVGLMATTYWWVSKNTDTTQGQAVIDPGRTPLQVHPTNISKINTVMQFVTIGGGMWVGMMNGMGSDIVSGLCYITAGTTIMSGLSYMGGASLKISSNMNQSNDGKDKGEKDSNEK